jgi:hypothetical protein
MSRVKRSWESKVYFAAQTTWETSCKWIFNVSTIHKAQNWSNAAFLFPLLYGFSCRRNRLTQILNPETKLLTTHKYLGIADHSISQASNENNRLPKQGWDPQHYEAFNKYLIQDGVHAFKQVSVGKRTSVDACTSARPAGYHGLDHNVCWKAP